MTETTRFQAGEPVPAWVLRIEGPGEATFMQDVEVLRFEEGGVRVVALSEGVMLKLARVGDGDDPILFQGAPTHWQVKFPPTKGGAFECAGTVTVEGQA